MDTHLKDKNFQSIHRLWSHQDNFSRQQWMKDFACFFLSSIAVQLTLSHHRSRSRSRSSSRSRRRHRPRRSRSRSRSYTRHSRYTRSRSRSHTRSRSRDRSVPNLRWSRSAIVWMLCGFTFMLINKKFLKNIMTHPDIQWVLMFLSVDRHSSWRRSRGSHRRSHSNSKSHSRSKSLGKKTPSPPPKVRYKERLWKVQCQVL